MPDKRMLNKKVVDTDAFLDMPLSAQALYFWLNLRADDDGFVSNPKRVQSYIGASEDDLKLLVMKRFLLCFPNGVMVIKHWLMHNNIRCDRYNPTDYQEEFKMLGIKTNKSYTLDESQMIKKCIPSAYQMDTKCIPSASTDLDIDLDIDLDKENTCKSTSVDYHSIISSFNSICKSYPKVTALSDNRKKAIKARLKTYKEEDLIKAFEIAEGSDFLKGKNDRNWSANFDWIMKDTNLAKILDGNYQNKTSSVTKQNSFNTMIHTDYDFEAIERKLLGE